MTTNAPAARAQTMRFQRAVNVLMRGVLRTPLLCRLAGKRLVELHVIGRSSHRHYRIPVAYLREGDTLLIGTPFAWVRNLRTGEPITIREKGRVRRADVEVITDERGVTDAFRLMARENHTFASFNSIGLDATGEPRTEDLHLAWAAGARAVRLTPRDDASAERPPG
jgi:hypothetical protein